MESFVLRIIEKNVVHFSIKFNDKRFKDKEKRKHYHNYVWHATGSFLASITSVHLVNKNCRHTNGNIFNYQLKMFERNGLNSTTKTISDVENLK